MKSFMVIKINSTARENCISIKMAGCREILVEMDFEIMNQT